MDTPYRFVRVADMPVATGDIRDDGVNKLFQALIPGFVDSFIGSMGWTEGDFELEVAPGEDGSRDCWKVVQVREPSFDRPPALLKKIAELSTVHWKDLPASNRGDLGVNGPFPSNARGYDGHKMWKQRMDPRFMQTSLVMALDRGEAELAELLVVGNISGADVQAGPYIADDLFPETYYDRRWRVEGALYQNSGRPGVFVDIRRALLETLEEVMLQLDLEIIATHHPEFIDHRRLGGRRASMFSSAVHVLYGTQFHMGTFIADVPVMKQEVHFYVRLLNMAIFEGVNSDDANGLYWAETAKFLASVITQDIGLDNILPVVVEGDMYIPHTMEMGIVGDGVDAFLQTCIGHWTSKKPLADMDTMSERLVLMLLRIQYPPAAENAERSVRRLLGQWSGENPHSSKNDLPDFREWWTSRGCAIRLFQLYRTHAIKWGVEIVVPESGVTIGPGLHDSEERRNPLLLELEKAAFNLTYPSFRMKQYMEKKYAVREVGNTYIEFIDSDGVRISETLDHTFYVPEIHTGFVEAQRLKMLRLQQLSVFYQADSVAKDLYLDWNVVSDALNGKGLEIEVQFFLPGNIGALPLYMLEVEWDFHGRRHVYNVQVVDSRRPLALGLLDRDDGLVSGSREAIKLTVFEGGPQSMKVDIGVRSRTISITIKVSYFVWPGVRIPGISRSSIEVKPNRQLDAFYVEIQ